MRREAGEIVTASFKDPAAVLQLVDKAEVQVLGEEVRALQQRVCANLQG